MQSTERRNKSNIILLSSLIDRNSKFKNARHLIKEGRDNLYYDKTLSCNKIIIIKLIKSNLIKR